MESTDQVQTGQAGEELNGVNAEDCTREQRNRTMVELAPFEERRLAAIAAAEARMEEIEAAERAARKRKPESDLQRS
jgi:hypothetical protein